MPWSLNNLVVWDCSPFLLELYETIVSFQFVASIVVFTILLSIPPICCSIVRPDRFLLLRVGTAFYIPFIVAAYHHDERVQIFTLNLRVLLLAFTLLHLCHIRRHAAHRKQFGDCYQVL